MHQYLQRLTKHGLLGYRHFWSYNHQNLKLVQYSFIADNYPIPTIAFYSPKTLQYIEQALNSDDYSFKNVYNQVDHAWLNVEDIDAPEYVIDIFEAIIIRI